MRTEDKSRATRALGLAVVAAVTSTSIACTDTSPTSAEDASRRETDAQVAADASSPVDASTATDAATPMDAAIAMDASVEMDASFAEDDADLPDGHYPDGIRG